MPDPPESLFLQRVRDAISQDIRATSLRKVASQVGMSPMGLRKVLDGSRPYPPTLRKLQQWYLCYAAPRRGERSPETMVAAMQVLTDPLPVPVRLDVRRKVVAALEEGFQTSGEALPSWLDALKARAEERPE